MASRHFNLAFLALPLLLSGSLSRGGDWPGWRGLDREGRSASPKGPVEWAPDKNVRWKTPIPGKGHSSPVVVGGRVIVTTGFSTERGQTARRAAGYAVSGLALLLAAWALFRLVAATSREESHAEGAEGAERTQGRRLTAKYAKGEREETQRVLGSQPKSGSSGFSFRILSRISRFPLLSSSSVASAAQCLMLGVLVQSAFSSHLRPGPEELTTDLRMERWLLSGAFAALVLMLGAFGFRERRRARVAVGAAALALAAFIILARPDPEYFHLLGSDRLARELQQTAGIPLVVGLVLLLGALLRRSQPMPAPKAADRPASARPALARLAVMGAAFAVGVIAFRVPLLLAVEACAVAWLVVDIANLGRGEVRLPRGLALGLLAVGALGLVVTNCVQGSREFVRAIVCLDRDTGKLLWTREALPGPQPAVSHRNSPATPTPVVADGRVYAWFGTPGCMCTDLDGRLLWTNTDVPFEDVHGVAASLMLADDLLLIVGAQPDAPYIRALDLKTGKAAWTATLRPWPGGEGQHRTPTIKSVDGKTLVLVWGWDGADSEDYLRAFDASTGKERWKFPIKTPKEAVASVISDGDTLYLLSSEGLSALSLTKLSRGEPPVLWTTDVKGEGQYVASPILGKGMLFVVTSHRRATCLDAATGKLLWRQRLRGRGCLASPVAVGDCIYFADNSGLTTVVACEPEFRLVAENDLSEPLFASPAPVDGRLYVRTSKHLWCIEEAARPASPTERGRP